MKKAFAFITMLAMLIMAMPTTALADNDVNDLPVLTAVAFENATIEGEFDQKVNTYSLKLDDPSVTPLLKAYEPTSAKVAFEYTYDETHHPIGVKIQVAGDNGVYNTYFFNYSNLEPYQENGNNLLASVSCDYCELSPAINDKDTEYTLYVPSDLIYLDLSIATQDINAYYICNASKVTLTAGQEFTIPIKVTASNGEVRDYKISIKRLDKTTAQVMAEMEDPNFKSLIDGERFYEQKAFKVGVLSAIAGIIMVVLFVKTTKRITIRVDDEDEKAFFDTIEVEEEEPNEDDSDDEKNEEE